MEIEISQAKIKEFSNRIYELIKAKLNTNLENSGVFGNLILSSCSLAAAYVEGIINDRYKILNFNNINFVNDSLSEEDLDRLGNVYGFSRLEGSKAKGRILVSISSFPTSNYTIPAGTSFSSGSELFLTTKDYNVKTNINLVVNDNDLFPIQIDTNQYVFVLEVEAQQNKQQTITFGKPFILNDLINIPNYLSSSAFEDFYPGSNRERNADFLSRILTFFNNKSVFNENSIKNLIETSSNLPVYDLAIIGPNDGVAKRNKLSLFPIGWGNAIDVCIKTINEFKEKNILMVCEMYDKTGSNSSYWKTTINRNVLPGFFEVLRVSKYPGGSPLNPIYFTYIDSLDSINNTLYLPDISSPKEANFSTFISTEFRFFDDVNDVSGMSVGDKALYLLTVFAPENIDVYTDSFYKTNSLERNDVLIKSAIPFVIDVLLSLSTSSTPAEVSSVVKDIINNFPMSETLDKNKFISLLSSQLSDVQIITLSWNGYTYNGRTKINYLDPPSLDVADNLDNIVTKKNVFYILRNLTVTIL